jgi:hypothetical protein
MIGEKVITAAGSRDGDSVSRMTDGTAVVDPESQGSGATGTPSPTAVGIFRSSGVSTDSFQIRAPPRDDDSMSGIYTTDGVSMTQEERFRARVLAEERKILKKFSLESGSKSEESYPEVSFMPTTLITAKTPSPDKKKKQKWSPFVGSVGTHDFDLDSLDSDGIMQEGKGQGKGRGKGRGGGGGGFHVLGIKSKTPSPTGTEKTRSPSTLGGNAALSSSYDDAFPELALAEGGYAGRSGSAGYASSKAKKKAAAAAAAAAGTSQMRPRVCRCRLERIICILVGVMMIALAIAIGALVAAKQTRGGGEESASQNEDEAPSPSAPSPSAQMPTLGQMPTFPTSESAPTSSPLPQGAFPVPTLAPSPKVVVKPSVPTSAPAFALITAKPTGLRATLGPSAASVTVNQSPTAVPGTPTGPACELPDANDVLFFVTINVGLQDCAWLANNPIFQIVLCMDGVEANNICRNTCNNCGPTPPPAPIPMSQSTSAPTLTPPPLVEATLAPTDVPTGTPLVATSGPTPIPVSLSVLVRDLILSRSPASAAALNGSTTSQARALAWLVSDVSTLETLTEDRAVQRWVMATLAFGADSGRWDRNNNWLGSGDVCTWFGIACDNVGNAVSLALRTNGLNGPLPSELSLLGDSLVSIDVGDNEVTGGFPSAFGRLTNLETLRLDRNAMTGEIPAEIGNMESLVALNFQRNRFSGPVPESIVSLQNLNELIFNTNDMTGIVPPAVCDFADLQFLVLDCREIACDCWTQCFYQCGGNTGVVCQNN